MKELRSIFVVLLLIAGGFVLYKVLPAYWGDYKLQQLLEEQALVFTYQSKPEADMASIIATKAADFNVALTPEQVKVVRTAGGLAIEADYTVHVDLPIHPIDLNFATGTKNSNVFLKK